MPRLEHTRSIEERFPSWNVSCEDRLSLRNTPHRFHKNAPSFPSFLIVKIHPIDYSFYANTYTKKSVYAVHQKLMNTSTSYLCRARENS